MLEHKND